MNEIRSGTVVLILIGGLLAGSASLVVAQETGEPAAEGSGATAQEADPASAAPEGGLGQQIFAEKCTRCHGDDGQAHTRMGERFEVAGFTTAHLAELGSEGIASQVREGGDNMRAVTDLTDEQMSALVAYILTLGQ